MVNFSYISPLLELTNKAVILPFLLNLSLRLRARPLDQISTTFGYQKKPFNLIRACNLQDSQGFQPVFVREKR